MPAISLDRGFANNGALARGAFFRSRLDTYRIYILLLLLGKRSSAERLFNTTRSLSALFYGTMKDPHGASSPRIPIKAQALSSDRAFGPADKNWSTARAERELGGWNCK